MHWGAHSLDSGGIHTVEPNYPFSEFNLDTRSQSRRLPTLSLLICSSCGARHFSRSRPRPARVFTVQTNNAPVPRGNAPVPRGNAPVQRRHASVQLFSISILTTAIGLLEAALESYDLGYLRKNRLGGPSVFLAPD
jgi:hypothetical protein